MEYSITRFPWFAPVLAAYPPLYIFVTNPGQAEGPIVALITAVAVAVAIVATLLLRIPLRTWTAAGLGTTWFVVLFFAYSPVNELFTKFVLGGPAQPVAGQFWHAVSLTLLHSFIWPLLLAAGLVLLRRYSGRIPERVSSSASIAAFVLLAFVSVQAAQNLAHSGSAVAPVRAMADAARSGAAGEMPDIYFILLDGYAREDILRDYYQFDNAPFLEGLRRRGFQVSNQSRANYAWTFLSLGSTLNYDYVQPMLGVGLDPASRDRSEMYRLLRDNRAARFLRDRGYRYVQLQSTWSGTGTNPYADEFQSCHSGIFVNNFLREIVDASWLRPLESQASTDVANCHLHNFETLAAEAKKPGPKFVLTHFVPPHHPYLFDRDGKILRHAKLSDRLEFQTNIWNDRLSYVEQLQFVNSRITSVLDRLIADSSQPPIILLVSDHGPNLKGLDPRTRSRMRLANLTAILVPGAPAGLIPDDASPVNHFRRIFNLTFDAGLPLLPDRYFMSGWGRPYRFREVDENDESLQVQGPDSDKM